MRLSMRTILPMLIWVITALHIAVAVQATRSQNTGTNIRCLATDVELQQWIAGNMVKIIDLRSSREYSTGHIPGAVIINNKEFEDPNNPVNGELAPAKQIEDLMSRKGISAEDHIIAYSARDKPQMATRLWWALKVYGHKDIQVLDGHFEAWVSAGGAVETGAEKLPLPAKYKAGPPDTSRIAVLKDCIHPSKNTVLLDVRPPEEYTGERRAENAGRGGHISGAVNQYFLNAVDDRGFFKDAKTLKDMYASVGVTPGKEVIVYCMRGHRASHTYFALVSLLKFPHVRLYDGSWIEWSKIKDLPVTTGPIR
jgi:thiosulfate/3-mercaptopyruvate sulfurtransferase